MQLLPRGVLPLGFCLSGECQGFDLLRIKKRHKIGIEQKRTKKKIQGDKNEINKTRKRDINGVFIK